MGWLNNRSDTIEERISELELCEKSFYNAAEIQWYKMCYQNWKVMKMEIKSLMCVQ